jgi:AAA domain/Primase C terminal 2 (PriCT-2)
MTSALELSPAVDAKCILCRPDPIFLNGERERFHVTFFPNYAAQTLTAREMSLGELRNLIINKAAVRKDALPWLKLARFGDKRTANNSLRHNANVKEITGAEVDYDGEAVTFEEAVAILANARLLSLVYTSPSHTAAKPRWRVVLPTSVNMPVEKRAQLVARVNGLLGGVIGPESFVLSQSYYFGKVGSKPDHRAVVVSGDYIDKRDDLDAGAIGKPNGKAIDHAELDRSHALVPTTIADLTAHETVTAAAVAAIPNPDLDWNDWIQIGLAIYANTGNTEGGRKIFHAFSGKSSKYDEAETDARWRRFHSSPPTKYDYFSIFNIADEADPGWGGRYDEELREGFREAYRPENIAQLLAELGAVGAQTEEPPTAATELPVVDSASIVAEQEQKSHVATSVPKEVESPPKTNGGGGATTTTRRLVVEPPRMERKQPETRIVMVRAADVVMRSKSWIWEGHLLCGALELLTGQPGLGKSQVHCHLVACATTRLKWPDGAPAIEPVNVIMVTAEDALDDEVVPRLIAAGANLERVHILKCIRVDNRQRQFLLAEDLAELERTMAHVGNVGLICIDPITAYMGGKMDSHKATEVRSQLGPLKDFAERTRVSVSAITHPAKNAGGRAIDQFIGSQAFVAAARIGHVCIEEIEEDEDGNKEPTGRTLFTNPKNNTHVKMPTLAYTIGEIVVGQDAQTRESITAPHVIWAEGVVNISANEALAAAKVGKSRDADQARVQAFLKEMLMDGKSVEEKVIKEYGDQQGFTDKQLKTAKAKLGIKSEKTGFDGGWKWFLPF